MSPRPLYFFDLDDTLVDHRAAEAAAHRETVASHPAVFGGVTAADWLSRYRARNLALWERYGRGEIGRPELSRRRFAEPLCDLGLDPDHGGLIGSFYVAAYARSWTLVEGAEEILEFAAEAGTAGILSNGFREMQHGKIARFGLGRWVRYVVLSEDVGAMKPAREIFDAAWKAAAGGADVRKVYVGDSFATDVVGAKNAGWFPVLFDPHGTGAPEPVVYVRKLVDLKPLLA